MSLNNDYTIQLWSQQRHQELMAAAANDRLASIAMSGRGPRWWRHSARATSRRRFSLVTSHSG
ncbi:MAG TPA: hypothetical protein VF642_06105 [Propionibacteriaceae bacterium]|jgi:hypothetical protein